MKKILLYLMSCFLAGGIAAQSLELWYRQPAAKWTEALPIGNGRLGAMIFGGIGEEHLQFNESTLWTGGPRDYQRPGAGLYLDSIRQLLFAGRQADAEALAERRFMGQKDKEEDRYAAEKKAWLDKVRADTGFAREDIDDHLWKDMKLPTPDGWEAIGMQGLDGAVWFRVAIDLPRNWGGRDLVLDLGRIRDMDYTYVNGILVGTGEGSTKRRNYTIKASVLRPGRNVIAIQVLNFDDKGGMAGVKGRDNLLLRLKDRGSPVIALPSVWKYKIQNEDPPALPKYEAEYQPFGDLFIRCPGQDKVTGYRRQLDMGNALSSVSYDHNGVHYTREYFASEPKQVLVAHFGADKPGRISLEASLTALHRSMAVRRVDDRTLALSVKVRNGVLRGVAYLHVEALHGNVSLKDDKISVSGADEVVFYLTAATNFINYTDISGDPEAKCRAVIASLTGMSYAAVRAGHIREYRRYFDPFSIRLGATGVSGEAGSESSRLPTDQRIAQYSVEKDPGLIALYVQYARYLLISSSRSSSPLPANLQGIWNDLLTPPWGSKYTTNINLEMNYWSAETLHLSDCSIPLFHMMKGLAKAGHLTAENYYHAPGWVLHHNTDLWLGTAPINASNHGIWVSGGAWLCHQLYEHYLFTGDTAFLREYYPILKASAEFFTKFLVPDPRSGQLISVPSNSPEHGGLVAGPTMDHQIIRDLFKNCIAAGRVLRVDSVFGRVLAKKYGRIAPNKIGRYGQLQEWLEDKDDTTDTHRHISHLWGVYPGTDISWKDPVMMRAARQSLLYRGDDGTGWSLAWKVNCWARFLDGDHALRLVDKLLSSAAGTQGGEKGGVYPNLFDAHPPFQIDGNFGGAAGIAEMLLQSQNDTLDLLPALPAALPEGSIRGICARGGFVLDIKWSHGVLQQVGLTASKGGDCILRYGKRRVLRIVTQKGKKYTFTGELKPIE
jgi:alpha-L-fucosidase 2